MEQSCSKHKSFPRLKLKLAPPTDHESLGFFFFLFSLPKLFFFFNIYGGILALRCARVQMDALAQAKGRELQRHSRDKLVPFFKGLSFILGECEGV